MKEYQVSYFLGDMYHSYCIDADSEEQARFKVLKSLWYPELLRELKIERYYREWN